MTNQLTRQEVEKKYGREYLKLLYDNPWLQNYRPQQNQYRIEEYQGIWLPSFSYLWRLVETFIPADPEKIDDIPAYLSGKLVLTTNRGKFLVKLNIKGKRVKKEGVSPEEALLKLFVALEKNDSFSEPP